jgi:hypothetical protein
VRTDDVGQSAPSGITQPIFHLAGYVGDRQDWNEPDTNLSLPTMDDGALPTPSQDAPAMRLWADGFGVNNPHEFDALLGLPSVHVRINVAQEAELDEIRAASRALDFAGNLRVSDTTQYFPNSAPTPLPDDLYSGRFDPDPSHLWTLLPYFDSPAPVQQRDTEQPQLSIEVQASDTNIGQTSSFVCDLCQIVCFDSTSLRCVIPRRTWVQCHAMSAANKIQETQRKAHRQGSQVSVRSWRLRPWLPIQEGFTEAPCQQARQVSARYTLLRGKRGRQRVRQKIHPPRSSSATLA